MEETRAAIKILHRQGGRLDTITTAQALKVVNEIRESHDLRKVSEKLEDGFSQNYSRRVIMSFKALLLWYSENTVIFNTPDGETKELKGNLNWKKIKAIEALGIDWDVKKSGDMLTDVEFQAVMDACTSSRDRAIVATLYDGSLRPGEIIGFTWGDLIRDDYGIRMSFITPKTKRERHIRFTYAVPFLNAWELDYPIEMTPSSSLFLQTVMHSHQYEPLTIGGLAMFIRRLKKRTGIKKLKPSIFRPSKITADVASGTDLQYIMLKNWGTLKTPMIDIYAKPGQDYVDKIALEMAGITHKVVKRQESSLQPVICPACQTLNQTGAVYCVQCGKGLSPEAISQEERLRREVAAMIEEAMKGRKKD